MGSARERCLSEMKEKIEGRGPRGGVTEWYESRGSILEIKNVTDYRGSLRILWRGVGGGFEGENWTTAFVWCWKRPRWQIFGISV